jgi:hypothetical protein
MKSKSLPLFRLCGLAVSQVTHHLEHQEILWRRTELLAAEDQQQRAEVELCDGRTVVVTVAVKEPE